MRKNLRQEIELKLHRYHLLQDEAWDDVIADQLKTFPSSQQELFYLRYIKKKSEREICEELHIEKTTYYNWVNNILSDMAIAAAYARLIEP